EAEPFDAQREHPVDGALQLILGRTASGADPLHPGPSVAEMEVLLGHHLIQAPLPRAVRALFVDVAKQAEAGLVIHAVGNYEHGPGVERDIERVRIAEALGVAAED